MRNEFVEKMISILFCAVWGLGTAVSAYPQTRTDPDGWDIQRLDTARDAVYLSRLEKDVILELNKVRSDPKKYADLYILPRTRYFRGNNYSLAAGRSITTVEGARAVEECYAALSALESVPLLSPREGLSRAAGDHAADQSGTGTTGHTGSDGSSFEVRIQRYGKWSGATAENISYGSSTGRDIVCQLLIDDGVASRGHRQNNMNRVYAYVGVAVRSHQRYETVCVMDFAAAYTTANNPEEGQDAARETGRQQAEQTQRLADRSDGDGANWNLAGMDTAKNAAYLSGFEKDVILELNKARGDPQQFARLYISSSGRNAETYRDLIAQTGLGLFTLERGLCLAAKDAEGSLADRAKKYGQWSGSLNEASVTGKYRTGRDLVIAFLRDKANRDRLLNPGFKHIGLSVGPVEGGYLKGVIQFASSYTSN
jgi:uncharacterized protein YkwD